MKSSKKREKSNMTTNFVWIYIVTFYLAVSKSYLLEIVFYLFWKSLKLSSETIYQ